MADELSIVPGSYDLSIKGNNNRQAGRDNIDIAIQNYFPRQDITMDKLIETYKQEQLTNSTYNQIIDELDIYLNPVPAEIRNIIGLEKKLQTGHFEEYINYAMRLKDEFYRKIERNRLSKAAQQIFLYVMVDVMTLFHSKIYPLICNNTAHEIIMSKIQDEIINVLHQKLGENILDIYSNHIYGMLYYLTGTCHIQWSKE
jgi:hypothetical protein